MTLVDDNKTEFNFPVGHNDKIIVDSGTTYLLMPYSLRKKFIDLLYDRGIKCLYGGLALCYISKEQQNTTLPDFVFHI